MEPNQQPTSNEKILKIEPVTKLEETSLEPKIPENIEVSEQETKTSETQPQVDEKTEVKLDHTGTENLERASALICNENVPADNESEPEAKENDCEKANLPSFPGTVTKSVPGSNDVKIEIDSNSLLDRVILYSLKNTVVDNSRLDAVRNKYMLHSGNITSNLNCNSNESDSNSSSKSVEKLIEEFKVGCSKANAKSLLIDSSGDNVNNESLKGAEPFVKTTEGNQVESKSEESSSKDTDQNVISPQLDDKLLAKPEAIHENSQAEAQELLKSAPPVLKQESLALDYRVNESPITHERSAEASAAIHPLDLASSQYNERSVPTVKRNHALYVGLPDFSKEIFSTDSANRQSSQTNLQQNAPTPMKQAEIKSSHQQIAVLPRGALNLQMNHPDFSRSFLRSESQSSLQEDLPITPSNFSEIARKKNYISDLQLKPTSQAIGKEDVPSTPLSTYKIDYSSTAAISQELLSEPKHEPPLVNYPNMKKEEINAYNQQLIVDEPMAHIIHKNQFLPHPESWIKRTEPLVNGSSLISKVKEASNSRIRMEDVQNRAQIPPLNHKHQSFDENVGNPCHYQRPFKADTHAEFYENQMKNEFSLKHKEQQLRQEGTIITIKNEPVKSTTHEVGEGSAEPHFYDYEMNRPNETFDAHNRSIQQPPFRSQTFIPRVTTSLDSCKYEKKYEIPSKPSSAAALLQTYPREMPTKQYPANNKSFTTSSPLAYNYKTEKLLTFQSGPSPSSTSQSWSSAPRHHSSLMPEPENKSFLSSMPYKHQPNHQSSRSSNIHDELHFPSQSNVSAVNMKPSYPPFKHIDPYNPERAANNKNIHYQGFSPSSYSRELSSEQKYYHQKYPDFSRHFEQAKKQSNHAQDASYGPLSHLRLAGGDQRYQRFPHPHEQEVRFSRDDSTSQYQQNAGPSHSLRNNLSPANILKDHRKVISINPDNAMRMNEEILERNRQSLKIERELEQASHKVHDRNLNYPPKLTNPSFVLPAMKTEQQTPVMERVAATTSIIEKSVKPACFAIKKDSPLDLSVKTVKTKADSTGCDQDISSKLSDPTGLKVEFTPNFNKIVKVDCRQQVLQAPFSNQDRREQNFSHLVGERPPAFLKTDIEFKNKNAIQVINAPVAQLQPPHPPRAFIQDQFNSSLKKDEKDQNPSSAHFLHRPDRSNILPTSRNCNDEESDRLNVSSFHQLHPSQEVRKLPDKSYAVPSKMIPHSSLAPKLVAAGIDHPRVGVMKPYHRIPTVEKPKASNILPNIPPAPRDPFYYERERDRKYVEEILYRRKRADGVPSNSNVQHFKPIVSPPRKRASELQHIYNSTSPKQGKIQEPSRELQMSRHHSTAYSQDNLQRNHEPPRLQKFEDHVSRDVSRGQVSEKNSSFMQKEKFENSFKSTRDILNHQPVSHKEPAFNEAIVVNSLQCSSSQYYPNPKAEMIQRADSLNSYNQDKIHLLNQNFQPRPDDTAFQLSSRIQHPTLQDSGIANISHPIGPGTISNELARPLVISGNFTSSFTMNSGSISRGADQSTILKLKTNLELKEQKKQSKSEQCDDTDEKQRKDFSPRQFRTKGELKGFIPLPVNLDKPVVNSTSSPSLPLAPSAFDLMDWDTACNGFVQQLQTVETRVKKKRTVSLKANEKKLPIIPVSAAPTDTIENSKVTPVSQNDEKNSSSDEDKPLLELVNNKSNGSDTNKTHSSVMQKISEKISRNNREKQRLELEQKHAARLGPSSSESDSEIRRPLRTAVRVRRLRKRAALGIKNTDEELSVEEETEDESSQKKRFSKSILKPDEDLTSSEDEKKMNKAKSNHIKDKTGNSNATKTSKKGAKLKENESEASGSDDTSNNKLTRQQSFKSAKKLRVLEPNDKTMLGEEKTMTRSKRKLEIEKKLSNSKILRNEKVVQNVTPDKKPKLETTPNSSRKNSSKQKEFGKADVKKGKLIESDSDANLSRRKDLENVAKDESTSSTEESPAEQRNKTERLRPRRNKQGADNVQKASVELQKHKIDEGLTAEKTPHGNVTELNSLPTLASAIPFTTNVTFQEEKASKFTPGWEVDTYNFKRSLKIPAGLITIGRPPQHGISHSLPDLDPQTSDTSEIFSEFVKSQDKVGLKPGSPKGKACTSKTPNSQDSKKKSSIIDLLHQRVVQSKKKFREKKALNVISLANQNPKEDLLPTPEKESEKVFGFKKNIFETSVITSRTRTENNAIRKKEILKEVFGADDERPRSAPPVGTLIEQLDQNVIPEQTPNMSYDQKYREYLDKMNVDFLSKCTPEIKESKTAETSPERELVTPTLKGKLKKGRGRRCKGSSGFDYIRKKKKPTTNSSENPMSVNNIIKKRLAAMENLENKNENDISKEIKGWVLNKGVGESVLHKASRLNYVDVIAYCLDRLNMGSDPKDNAGYTPLHEACSRGHLEIARILLQYGANHSETALSGIRPLHEAIENGHVEIVRLLISYGADPCLATYSGQLPISMADDKAIESFLSEYLMDVDDTVGAFTTWYFEGAYKIEDPSEQGYEVFNDIPFNKSDFDSSLASVFSTSLTSLVTATTQMSDNDTAINETTATLVKEPVSMKLPNLDLVKYQVSKRKCDTNSNTLVMHDNDQENSKINSTASESKSCSLIFNKIESSLKKPKKKSAFFRQDHITSTKFLKSVQKLENAKHKDDYDDLVDEENLDSDTEFLELEESDAPLPPLYLLQDEGSDKWILLTDLCSLLKVKSKDAVLKQICPSSPPSVNKELIRELKMSDFLEKAICLQLFCAGEKLNVRASKVSLVRYNESVRNLLGVQSIRMSM